jgi:predicted acyltransferase
MGLSNKRLLSLDILRGITIIFMIIVNDPGSLDHVYGPLLHASWNGITPTDYIFPNFLFIIGVSIVLSVGKQIDSGKTKTEILKKIIWRSIKIYLVGLFLWLFPEFDFSSIRWTGVLQRISFVFLFCSIIYLYTSWKSQILICAVTLIFYWITMVYVPIPDIGMPDLSLPEKNWAHFIDKLFLPGVLWQKTWDPEGILTTIPSIITGVFGLLVGYILTLKKNINEQLVIIFAFGVLLIFLGDCFRWLFPINKNLWSTSYTLLMGGISALTLAFFIYIIDVLKYQKHINFAHVFGVNSIFSYTLAGVFTIFFYSNKLLGLSLSESFVSWFVNIGLQAKLGSLIYALLYVVIIWIPTYYLYKKKIFIKL